MHAYIKISVFMESQDLSNPLELSYAAHRLFVAMLQVAVEF